MCSLYTQQKNGFILSVGPRTSSALGVPTHGYWSLCELACCIARLQQNRRLQYPLALLCQDCGDLQHFTGRCVTYRKSGGQNEDVLNTLVGDALQKPCNHIPTTIALKTNEIAWDTWLGRKQI